MTINRRLTRVNEILKREIASSLFRFMDQNEIDLSAVTVTGVDVSSNLRHAKVRVSIRDHQGERQDLLARIKRHRKEIQNQIHQAVHLKYTPHLEFMLDDAIEKGDHVLDILDSLNIEEDDCDGTQTI